MSYKLSRFDRAAAGVLSPGETIIAGTWAGTPGSYAREMTMGAIAGQLGTASAGAFALPRQFEVAVTDRRLLFFRRSPWTGRPSTLVLELPKNEVVGAANIATKQGQLVTIALTDKRVVLMEVVKAGAKRNASSLVAALPALANPVGSTNDD